MVYASKSHSFFYLQQPFLLGKGVHLLRPYRKHRPTRHGQHLLGVGTKQKTGKRRLLLSHDYYHVGVASP